MANPVNTSGPCKDNAAQPLPAVSEPACPDCPVTIDTSGGPIQVEVVNPTDITDVLVAAINAQTASLTAELQAICDKLDAGITVNAQQSGTWTVSIDGQPLSTELSAASIDALVADLAAATLQVNIAGQDADVNVNVTNDPLNVAVDFDDLITFMRTIVRVDYEETRFCVLDGNGDRVPATGVFTEVRYDWQGALISRDLVLSQVSGSAWTSYTLGAGESIGECSAQQQECYIGPFTVKELAGNGVLDRVDFIDSPVVDAAQVDADRAAGDSFTTVGAVLDSFDFSATPDNTGTQSTLDVADYVTGGGTNPNISVVTGFIASSGATDHIQFQTSNQAAIRVYMGLYTGNETVVAEVAKGTGGAASGRTVAIPVPFGVHTIRIVTYDYDGANGNWIIRSSATSAGFSNGLIPSITFGNDEPIDRCFIGQQCKGSPDIIDLATELPVAGAFASCGSGGNAECDDDCNQSLASLIADQIEQRTLNVNQTNTVTLQPEMGGSATIVDDTFTFPANAKSISIAPNDAASDYDFVGGTYNTLASRISMSIGDGNDAVISNSNAATLTARGTIQVAWEV